MRGKIKPIIILLLIIGAVANSFSQSSRKKSVARLEIRFPSSYSKDSISIKLKPFKSLLLQQNEHFESLRQKIKDGKVLFELPVNEYVYVDISSLFPSEYYCRLLEPGDSIVVQYHPTSPSFTGKGSAKFEIMESIKKATALVPEPNNSIYLKVKSVDDYLDWNRYLNAQAKLVDSITASFEARLTPMIVQFIKADRLSYLEYLRLLRFGMLVNTASSLRVSNTTLNNLFDSTAVNKYNSWLKEYEGICDYSHIYHYDFVRLSVARRFNFDYNNPVLKTVKRKILYWQTALKLYKGFVLQDVLAWLLTDGGLKDQVLKSDGVAEIEALLLEYYKLPGNSEYKSYVRNYERKIREEIVYKDSKDYDFELLNSDGKLLTKADFKGKIILLSFFDSSAQSAIKEKAILKVQQGFNKNENIVFINVQLEDKQLRKKTPKTNNITDAITLSTNVRNSRTLQLLDPYGVDQGLIPDPESSIGKDLTQLFVKYKIKSRVITDPALDNGQELIRRIKRQLQLLKDGPYVLESENIKKGYSRYGDSVIEKTIQSSGEIEVATDEFNKSFKVQVQAFEKNPASIHKALGSIFALSDIEGNFDAFRKLLVSNKVIDDKLNWTFGKGHLVFAGDMFDRGQQVTECLWLIYSLEKKAKAAGGMVHFVLGNHEIMNLSGDLHYVHDKYKKTAKIFGKNYTDLYSEKTELGAWLRTKNIIEKIGDVLFVHGGISAELNELTMQLDQINQIAKTYYHRDTAATKSHNKVLSTIYDTKKGLFWYRLYYQNSPRKIYRNKAGDGLDTIYKTSDATIEKTLTFYGVRHIVTGHTVIDPGEHVSVHYNNKVINTDTEHAKGKSEALLIENNNYYRVNDKGQRYLLFKDKNDGKPSSTLKKNNK